MEARAVLNTLSDEPGHGQLRHFSWCPLCLLKSLAYSVIRRVLISAARAAGWFRRLG
jgi:hypothetical protein